MTLANKLQLPVAYIAYTQTLNMPKSEGICEAFNGLGEMSSGAARPPVLITLM